MTFLNGLFSIMTIWFKHLHTIGTGTRVKNRNTIQTQANLISQKNYQLRPKYDPQELTIGSLSGFILEERAVDDQPKQDNHKHLSDPYRD
jgi:Fe-S-cluster formation regulator IscX/YfhJ